MLLLLLYPAVTARQIQEAPHRLGHLPGDVICTRPRSGRRDGVVGRENMPLPVPTIKSLTDEEGTIGRRTRPMCTMGNMDLIFFRADELSTEMDANAFDDVMLQLLTGLLDRHPPLLLWNNDTNKNNALPPPSSRQHQVVPMPGLRRWQGRGGVVLLASGGSNGGCSSHP
jgi:hypothetical protein